MLEFWKPSLLEPLEPLELLELLEFLDFIKHAHVIHFKPVRQNRLR